MLTTFPQLPLGVGQNQPTRLLALAFPFWVQIFDPQPLDAPNPSAGVARVGRAEVRGEALQQVLARRGGAARALHQLPKHEEQLLGWVA